MQLPLGCQCPPITTCCPRQSKGAWDIAQFGHLQKWKLQFSCLTCFRVVTFGDIFDVGKVFLLFNVLYFWMLFERSACQEPREKVLQYAIQKLLFIVWFQFSLWAISQQQAGAIQWISPLVQIDFLTYQSNVLRLLEAFKECHLYCQRSAGWWEQVALSFFKYAQRCPVYGGLAHLCLPSETCYWRISFHAYMRVTLLEACGSCRSSVVILMLVSMFRYLEKSESSSKCGGEFWWINWSCRRSLKTTQSNSTSQCTAYVNQSCIVRVQLWWVWPSPCYKSPWRLV